MTLSELLSGLLLILLILFEFISFLLFDLIGLLFLLDLRMFSLVFLIESKLVTENMVLLESVFSSGNF